MLSRCGGFRSSQTSMRARAADDRGADLGGAQPVDVDVGERAVRQRQRQVAHAGAPGADRVGAVRRHRDRTQILGQDEVEDREVVRREVPEHVDVGLHQPEVDAHRVDVLDVAELAAIGRARGSAARPACSSRCGRTSARGRVLCGQVDQLRGLRRAMRRAASRPARACPPPAAARTRSKWVAAGVAIATAATAGSASTCS